MTKPVVNLDSPIYETIYLLVNATGTVVYQLAGTERDLATAEAKRLGLRLVKTVKEVTE